MLDDGIKIQNSLSRLKWWTHTADCTEGFKDVHSCRKREMWLSNSPEIDFCKSREPVDCLLIWLMDELVFYFISIVFLNAWILISLDKAFIFRFPTALLAPWYLTSSQIHIYVNCMVSASIWNCDPQSQDFCLFPHLFCLDQDTQQVPRSDRVLKKVKPTSLEI